MVVKTSRVASLKDVRTCVGPHTHPCINPKTPNPNAYVYDHLLGRTGLIIGLYGVVFHGEDARDVH